MIIEPFRMEDIDTFLEMATAESWVADPWEFVFLLEVFPGGCFCVRDCNGKGVAFVTSLRHETSGWIGNLIVAAGYRGEGFGDALFRKAQEALHAAGVKTFWLTASKMGKSLYERYGYRSIDSIARWVGSGRQRYASPAMRDKSFTITPSVISIDSHGWGDRREQLLSATMGRGQVVCEESGFIVAQFCGATLQLGPFSALDSGTAEVLFETALRSIPLGKKIALDAPISNRSALRLFNRKGLRIAGRNELMYAGAKPDYRPEILYGMATMGSCG
jgi:ribosomal protein S18 acetylase RimI-like enzyme